MASPHNVGHSNPWHGGSRLGAGRKAMGITKKVSITMSEDDWSWIGDVLSLGDAESYSEVFRKAIQEYRGG